MDYHEGSFQDFAAYDDSVSLTRFTLDGTQLVTAAHGQLLVWDVTLWPVPSRCWFAIKLLEQSVLKWTCCCQAVWFTCTLQLLTLCVPVGHSWVTAFILNMTSDSTVWFIKMGTTVTHLLLTRLGPCLPVPLCTAGPHPPHRLDSPTIVFLLRSHPNFVYADYLIGHYIFLRKLCFYGNKRAAIFESKFLQNFLHRKQHSFQPIFFK